MSPIYVGCKNDPVQNIFTINFSHQKYDKSAGPIGYEDTPFSLKECILTSRRAQPPKETSHCKTQHVILHCGYSLTVEADIG